ncbi:TPR-like protein [Suhomyces tanzawaensis NRRL Y-17324]|uniref:TPR-like protein n=1 Tax=Suhomyces tanzawaensis NRRL Y-17324 TaxID=984487 RepID=A0A1E4SCB3_9ASCO|nr:TPR-like protein [Suhomyces tanzawaensis NRRL Y-17324]ODV77144.1 TPR-like protein [Suhomyces tanzawaensis NRRL Y-17324]
MSGIDSTTNFFARNRTVIAVTALAGLSAAGAYYYLNQPSAGDAPDAGKKKKNKKKKAKKAGEDSGANTPAPAEKEEKTRVYPVNAQGLPEVSDEVINGLTEAQKEEWALALKEDGNNEFKAKNYDDAIAYYTVALQIKKDPIFYSNRSACYAALNDHENVIKDTTEAIKIKPDYTKCVLRRATSYETIERYEDAMFDLTALTIYGGFSNKSIEQVLERVLKKHSIKIVESKPKTFNLPSASIIGSFFGAFVEETTPEGISEQSEGADKFLYDALVNININTQEGYEQADTLLNQALEAYNIEELSPESPQAGPASIALEYSAAFSFLKNQPQEAASGINKAIALKPRPRSYIFRALINADKQSYDDAIKDFAKAQEMDPECPDIFYHLGQLHYLTGDMANAEVNFVKAKSLNPENVYAYIQLACITYKNGLFDSAIEKFTEAKLKFATSPEVPTYYGEILADRGDIEGACKQFDIAARLQESLKTFSVGSLPLINKATCISRESLERMPEAEELLVRACELDPKSELAKLSLAQIKLQQEKVDEAIELFEESTDLARNFEEKVQATSFAEATKMQKRIRNDPVLTKKIAEVMQQSGAIPY